ncbi:FG-GAP repeat protein [Chryseobacterium sp. CKR4-1]|uniref:FG-GAP repeat protein n=1 Tax=Chryseobacterium sp. CKR4-1 TaxID=3068896 RepID=UPI002796BE1D|nr:FG-GAP repeat protein [Chryseobacterium sp. CKR4-1]MDQ1805139.1 FG-GAP repeat protein [Chryseobacterium sp. CKR4-1]
MNSSVILIIFIILGSFCSGQQHFEIKDGSLLYNADITVQDCDADKCSGNGTIILKDKRTSRTLQEFTSDDLYFYLGKDQQPSVNVIQLYDEQSPLIFKDFNFDGFEDIAIRNGNESSYGGPSYDVYVYNTTRKQFVISEELTDLARENLGMFQTDPKRKRLITFSKSGCCWHLTTEYRVLPGKGLDKVFELEEDAMNDESVKVTRREKIKNKWIIKTKRYPIKEYYKE